MRGKANEPFFHRLKNSITADEQARSLGAGDDISLLLHLFVAAAALLLAVRFFLSGCFPLLLSFRGLCRGGFRLLRFLIGSLFRVLVDC